MRWKTKKSKPQEPTGGKECRPRKGIGEEIGVKAYNRDEDEADKREEKT